MELEHDHENAFAECLESHFSKIKNKAKQNSTKHGFHRNEVNSHCYQQQKDGGNSLISKVLLKINPPCSFTSTPRARKSLCCFA